MLPVYENESRHAFYQFPSTNLKAVEYNAKGSECLHKVLMTRTHTELCVKKVSFTFFLSDNKQY